jgi:ABC-type antimicrobial peptide transport system permease subunit
LIGLALGIVAALVVGRLLANLLYSVTPADPVTLMSVAAVTVVAALLAAVLPARRAARTSLLEALRYE